MSETAEGGLVARVERLERQNRRLRRALVSVAVLTAAGLLMAPAPRTPPKPVRTSELQIVDDQGVARISMRVAANGDPKLLVTAAAGDAIELGMNEGHPELSLRALDRAKAVLGIEKDGPALDLASADGSRTAKVRAGGSLGLFVGDTTGGRRAASVTLGDTGPSVSLVSPDESGSPAIALQLSSPFGPLLAVTKGLASASLNVSPDQDPSVTITDGKGRDRAVLGVTRLSAESRRRGKSVERRTTDPSSLVLFAPDQTVVWKAP